MTIRIGSTALSGHAADFAARSTRTSRTACAGSIAWAAYAALAALAALALGPLPARAGLGDSLWKFYADFSVTVAAPVPDLSGNGGSDLLAGSQDDSLYAVEGRGAGAGSQLWAYAFKSTLSAAAALPDLDGDGRPDAAGGDEAGMIAALSGADGRLLWRYLSGLGTVLSLAPLPDVDGDGAADLAAGSEVDTVFCLSGKPGSVPKRVLWTFGLPAGRIHGPPAQAKRDAGPPSTAPSGANSLALVADKGKAPFGLAVGANNDTVYCLALADGAVKWKTGLAGDAWKVAAFPDVDGDGIGEVLVACGADAGYLLNGATGAIRWTHAVGLGASAVAAAPDMDGDGRPDALIGDGEGALHCVSGAAAGAAKAAWTYSFGDGSTVLAIAVPGDLDGDGRAECVVGTSNDSAALISGKGARLWAAGLGGQVPAVAAGDFDGDPVPDWAAASAMGFAQAFSGGGTVSLVSPAPHSRAMPIRPPDGRGRILFEGPGGPRDGAGRRTPER